MKKFTPFALLATLALSLSACANSGTVEKGGAETPVAESKATEAPAEQPDELQFGDKFKWDNGVSLSISKPSKYEPSEYAIAGETDDHVVFTVTVNNGTDEPFDPNLIYLTASSGGEESEQIYDDKIGETPTTTVKPGKSIKYKIGFSVLDPKDITMDATPDMMEFDSKTFTN